MTKTPVVLMCAIFIATASVHAQRKNQTAVIDLWTQGKPAFGVFVPNESTAPRGEAGRGTERPPAVYTRDGGEKLAMNPLYDFLFLNLEGRYDAAAIKSIAEGLRSPKAVSRKTLLVRIPSIHEEGVAVARTRVKEALDLGADGVTFPHVQSLEEAKQALALFQEAKANVWSTSNPNGEKLLMIMLEDPGAVAQSKEIADLKGYSILACGIGSLTASFGGNREKGEAGVQRVLAESKRARLVNMLTASPKDVEQRVKEGFLALLAQGPSADETIKIGRAAAGR